MQITVKEASPSLNKFAFAISPFVQRKEKMRWAYLIRSGVGYLDIPKAKGRRRLTIKRYGRRSLDIDNLIGGAKCCITDNLVKLGLLVDDNPEMLEIHGENQKLGKGEKPHTVLILEDI